MVLGFVICWRLPQDPEHSAFLTPAEQQWCLDRWAGPMPVRIQTIDAQPICVSHTPLSWCKA